MPSKTPHDALVHSVFSHPEQAAGELRSVLPAELAAAINWSSLSLHGGHFVDPQLDRSESDLLFEAAMLDGSRALLYLLFEHQSTADRWMPLRLLRYELRIWDRWRIDHPDGECLPIILPVVLSHAEGGWNAPTSMHELFRVPEPARAALPLLPQFHFLLDDLIATDDERLMSRSMRAFSTLALLMLRHIRDRESPAGRLPEWTSLLHALWSEPDGRRALAILVRYLLLANQKVTRQDLARELMPILGEAAREVTMTEGERLLKEGEAIGEARGKAIGEARGKAIGEARGKAEGVLAVLAARGLTVSASQRERILVCLEMPLLDRWIARAVSVRGVDELFGEEIGR